MSADNSTANSTAAPLPPDQRLALLDTLFALGQQGCEEAARLFDLLWTALFTQEGGQS
ncbi:MAG: hypothetical protein IT324_05205 [Anaerolineae bacterium]|nr:hypothetical protein [Anaerolineae bacterium]